MMEFLKLLVLWLPVAFILMLTVNLCPDGTPYITVNLGMVAGYILAIITLN